MADNKYTLSLTSTAEAIRSATAKGQSFGDIVTMPIPKQVSTVGTFYGTRRKTGVEAAGNMALRYGVGALGLTAKIASTTQGIPIMLGSPIVGALNALREGRIALEQGKGVAGAFGAAGSSFVRDTGRAYRVGVDTIKKGSMAESFAEHGVLSHIYNENTGTATKWATDVFLDPAFYFSGGILGAARGARAGLQATMAGKKVVGTTKTGLRLVSAMDYAKIIRKTPQAVGKMARIVNWFGSTKAGKAIAKNAKRYAVSVGGKEEIVARTIKRQLGEESLKALQNTGRWGRYRDFVQREAMTRFSDLEPAKAIEKVLTEVIRTNGYAKMTASEFATSISKYIDLDVAVRGVSSGLAVRKAAGAVKGVFDVKDAIKMIKKAGTYDIAVGVGKNQKVFTLTEASIPALKKIALQAKDAGYELIIKPFKAPMLSKYIDPTDAKAFIQDAFVRPRAEGQVLAKPIYAPKDTFFRKFLYGNGITDDVIGNAAQKRLFDNIMPRVGNDPTKARQVIDAIYDAKKEMIDNISSASKGSTIERVLTAGEGLSGPQRIMDIPNKILNEIQIAKSLGIDNLAKVVKNSFVGDWSLMGVTNLGTMLRANSNWVDVLARARTSFRFERSPMFVAQNWVEAVVINVIYGKKVKVINATMLDDFVFEFAATAKKAVSADSFGAASRAMGKGTEFATAQVKSFDMFNINKTGKKLTQGFLDAQAQGTFYKNADGVYDYIQQVLTKKGKLTYEQVQEKIGKYATEHFQASDSRALQRAVLDLYPQLEPAMRMINNSAEMAVEYARSLAQMTAVRGGFERSANYILFPSSYVKRATVAMIRASEIPIGRVMIRTIDRAQKDAKEWIEEKYGKNATVLPGISWAIQQFIPMGFADLGAGVDPIARYIMASIGLKVSASNNLARTTIPIYRNVNELNSALKEIKRWFETGQVPVRGSDGLKLYMDKATYDYIREIIPFDIENWQTPTPVNTEDLIAKAALRRMIANQAKKKQTQARPQLATRAEIKRTADSIIGSPLL